MTGIVFCCVRAAVGQTSAAPPSIMMSSRRLIRYILDAALSEAARFPAAGAELAAVDDAVVLVARGAEHGGATHPPAADLAVEEITDRAALVARCERELDLVAAEQAADRPLELGGALVAGEFGAALFKVEAMDARPLQEFYAQFPVAGDLALGERGGDRLMVGRLAQRRRDRVADLRRLAGLQLEWVDRNRVLGRRIVVEHDARLAVEHPLAQRQPVERILPTVPGDAQPRHAVDAGGLDQLQCSAVHLAKPLADDFQIIIPSLLLDFVVELLKPMLDRRQDANDVLFRDLHRAAQGLVRRRVRPGRLDELLRAEEEAARLRAAQELAAAVDARRRRRP